MDSQIPASLDEEVASLSRSADRDSLFLQAALTLPGHADAVMVRVRNLSPGGMLAEARVNVAQGAAIVVELNNIGPVAGRVIWVSEGKFGIAFERTIDPQAVRRQVVSGSRPSRQAGLAAGPFYRQR